MKPNIIEIIWHDLGDHLNCYGYNTIKSPNLDSFAKEGVMFNNMFCTSPGCSPSRASLMTGRYPHSNGMFGLAHHRFEYFEGQKTIAHVLKEHGYHTYLCGSEHEFSPSSLSRYKNHEDLHKLKCETLGYDEIINTAQGKTRMKEVSWDACSLIESRLSGSSEPFYLNIGSSATHRPYYFDGVDEVTDEEMANISYPHYIPDSYSAKKDYAQFVKVLEDADHHVGKVLESIKKVGLDDNTIIFFTTDHGAAFYRAKTTLYDPGVKVACMFQWKNKFTSGKVMRNLYSNMDIMPTLLELAEIEIPDFVQGKSFASSLLGDEKRMREYVFCEKTYHTVYDPLRSIRDERYKLIWNKNYHEPMPVAKAYKEILGDEFVKRSDEHQRSEFELYDLKHDPDERKNVAEQQEYSDVFNRLKQSLFDEMRSTDDPILQGDIPPLSDQERCFHESIVA